MKPENKKCVNENSMDEKRTNEKCVMVLDENLPLGILANTAAIMGITLKMSPS